MKTQGLHEQARALIEKHSDLLERAKQKYRETGAKPDEDSLEGKLFALMENYMCPQCGAAKLSSDAMCESCTPFYDFFVRDREI